jgi:hypothetical protein
MLVAAIGINGAHDFQMSRLTSWFPHPSGLPEPMLCEEVRSS